jgi:hypothetical protein
VVEVAAMDTYADQLLEQLSMAYGEFWETWLVPTAIGAGVWCARLHRDHQRYINAGSPAMLRTLLDQDDQLAGRVHSPAATATRAATTATSKASARGDGA